MALRTSESESASTMSLSTWQNPDSAFFRLFSPLSVQHWFDPPMVVKRASGFLLML